MKRTENFNTVGLKAQDTSEPLGVLERMSDAIARVAADPGTGLVWLANFEVEEEWALEEARLIRLSTDSGAKLVERLDEFAVWLARTGDTVILAGESDPDFLDYVARITGQQPSVVRQEDTLRACASDPAQGPEAENVSAHALVTHAPSRSTELLAHEHGWSSAWPEWQAVKRVNSKVYSRLLANKYGITQPRGFTCTSTEEWIDACEQAKVLLEDGPVAVKEAFGVSGKGLYVANSDKRLASVSRKVLAASTAQSGRLQFCIESWIDKATDYNYQFTVFRDGTHQLDFIKEAITDNGVHRGHLMPARLSDAERAKIEETANIIATALSQDGYWGIVGVDAMKGTDGTLYPLLEINARFNMSTYQVPAQERFLDQHAVALARHLDIEVSQPVAFHEIRSAMGALLAEPGDPRGVVVLNHATLNAGLSAASAQASVNGRLYVLIFARDESELARTHRELEDVILQLGKGSTEPKMGETVG